MDSQLNQSGTQSAAANQVTCHSLSLVSQVESIHDVSHDLHKLFGWLNTTTISPQGPGRPQRQRGVEALSESCATK